ncbi:unnamed protein product, partial [Iphiclides podalirius]
MPWHFDSSLSREIGRNRINKDSSESTDRRSDRYTQISDNGLLGELLPFISYPPFTPPRPAPPRSAPALIAPDLQIQFP